MQKRQLGNSDLYITPIGYGAWAIGGAGWAFAWGHQDDADSIASIHEAIDLGINWIDTAAVYGFGHSEEVVAKALDGIRNRPYLFTKCSRIFNPKTQQIESYLSPESIRNECEASLKRLKVDVIDLYQIHWPMPEDQIEEGWTTLKHLQQDGKVRWIGVSNFSAEQMARVAPIAPITSLQPPYSLVRREIEAKELPYCAQNNIGVLAYSPMASGLLTGAMTRERIQNLPSDDWRKEKNKQFQEPLLTRNLLLVDLLKQIGQKQGRSPGEVAIAWTLRQPVVTAAIVGARKAGQLKELIGAAEFRLSAEEEQQIETFLKDHPG